VITEDTERWPTPLSIKGSAELCQPCSSEKVREPDQHRAAAVRYVSCGTSQILPQGNPQQPSFNLTMVIQLGRCSNSLTPAFDRDESPQPRPEGAQGVGTQTCSIPGCGQVGPGRKSRVADVPAKKEGRRLTTAPRSPADVPPAPRTVLRLGLLPLKFTR
jgi:hypothetical protein